tara:strand:- start:2545 stop:2871 length:327 start_codon:yes stop_codon:yes gene_type:complete
MNIKLINSLSSSLLLLNKLELTNAKEISHFVDSQIKKMPDFFRAAFFIISFFFEILIILSSFKRFSNLSDKKKIRLLKIIKQKKIPVFSLYVRFFESNCLVKYYELSN